MIHTSVIIPTYDSPWLAQVIEALHKQAYDLAGTEVLIVGLDDGAPALEDELVRYIPTDGPTMPAESRNLGIKQARGDLLCFLDSDCLPTKQWLAEITKPFATPEINVVGGTITFPDDYWTTCDTVAQFSYVIAGARPEQTFSPNDLPMLRQIPSLNFCARRSIFDKVGMFDESFTILCGEDMELTKRMLHQGVQLYLVEKATVFHAAKRRSLRETLERSYRYGQAPRIPAYRRQMLDESLLFNRWVLLLTMPARALAVTLLIFYRYVGLRQYWYTIPIVFLIKLVWNISLFRALGAAPSTPLTYARVGSTE